MNLDYSKNLTHEMRSVCMSEQSAEVNDLTQDYLEFCEHLKDLGNDEIVPLSEFAIWRNQEFEAQDEFTNPIPALN